MTNHFSDVRFFSYPSLQRSVIKVILDAIKKEFGPATKTLSNDLYVNYGKDGFYVNASDKKFASVEQCITYLVRYYGIFATSSRQSKLKQIRHNKTSLQKYESTLYAISYSLSSHVYGII